MAAPTVFPFLMGNGVEQRTINTNKGYWQAIWDGLEVIGELPAPARSTIKATLADLDAIVVQLGGNPGGGGATVVTTVNGKPGPTITLSAEDLAEGTTKKFLTFAERAKLSGIATGATLNSPDSFLRDRSKHIGSQTADTISNLTPTVQGIVNAMDIQTGGASGVVEDPNDSGFFISGNGSGSGGSSGVTLVEDPSDPGTYIPSGA